MLLHLRRTLTPLPPRPSLALARLFTTDHRNRLTTFFAPSGGIAASAYGVKEDTHSLLMRTGYLRQAHAGVFHYLPLGQRVHEKLERLIDKHMRSIGASKLALSAISSEKLWAKTGRLEKGGAELFRIKDRKNARLLLSPTHEEEITTLVSSLVSSHKHLPLRLYQTTRKFRDERRPRAGLLRGREFTMKDLYTFDATPEAALETYAAVQGAYRNLFDELKLPYLVAEADSGTIGGTLSHEYHYPSLSGEDTVFSCNECSYSANAEAARTRTPAPHPALEEPGNIAVFHGVSTDRATLINVFYPRDAPAGLPNEVNVAVVRGLVPTLDAGVGSAEALDMWRVCFREYSGDGGGGGADAGSYSQIVNLFDTRLPHSVTEASFSNHSDQPLFREFVADKRIPTTAVTRAPATGEPLNLLKLKEGEGCPACATGVLVGTGAVELGHTFHLGTRYSTPLRAVVTGADGAQVPMEMGCHGIGVSRMISAVAEGYRDDAGLCWPRVAAPFEVVVVAKDEAAVAAGGDAEGVYDGLAGAGLDVLLDDREKDFVWCMKDAELVGYPVCVVLGRGWKDGRVEVQVRSGRRRLEVGVAELRETVLGALEEA
ncbi:prolyl-tRNA synthetase-like protein [Morchella snyderi]|nr:prolyl-tRNA synthetase-like protein [Morchella snyderi]